MYKRSSFITSVKRVGHNANFVRIASKTRVDRDVAVHKADSGSLKARIVAASAAALHHAFDIVTFQDITLAGIGPSATFHFVYGSGLESPADSSPLAPDLDLAGLRAAVQAPLKLADPRAAVDSGPHVRSMLRPELAPDKNQLVSDAVLSSWAFVKDDIDLIGQRALVKLFVRDPPLLKLFGFRNDPDVLASRGLKMHASAIVRTIGKVLTPRFCLFLSCSFS